MYPSLCWWATGNTKFNINLVVCMVNQGSVSRAEFSSVTLLSEQFRGLWVVQVLIWEQGATSDFGGNIVRIKQTLYFYKLLNCFFIEKIYCTTVPGKSLDAYTAVLSKQRNTNH